MKKQKYHTNYGWEDCLLEECDLQLLLCFPLIQANNVNLHIEIINKSLLEKDDFIVIYKNAGSSGLYTK